MSRKILGLDIRHDAVSAVVLKSGIKETDIEGHVHIPISNHIYMETVLAASLKTIVEKIDISASVCVASFPANEISYRNIRVPFKGRKKIKKILPYELEPTVPFPIDDLIIDFYTLELDDVANRYHLITAAVEKSRLQAYLEILASFNIDPQIVTVGGYPAALCAANLVTIHDNWLFLDIDTNKSTLFAILSKDICLIRSFPNRSDARPFEMGSLCTNIWHTLTALEEMMDLNFKPEGVFITGCGLDHSGFDQDMEQRLGFPVKRTDFVRDTGIIKKHADSQLWNPQQMDNSFSLALMEIEGTNGLNFRKGPFAAKKMWEEHKKSLIKTGIIAGVVIMLAFFNVVLDSYFMGKKVIILNNQITDVFTSTFPDVKKIVDPLQQMRIKIQEARKNALLPGVTDKNIRAIDILNDISKLISNNIDVNFTRLVIGAENTVISGDTDTFNSVDGIKNGLEKSKLFKKVVISSANINKSDNRVRFKLKIDL
ncbi:MAG: pilus assembly protein PilM [Desulfobacterales bacterium]|jgi:type II secretory pathway component PulL